MSLNLSGKTHSADLTYPGLFIHVFLRQSCFPSFRRCLLVQAFLKSRPGAYGLLITERVGMPQMHGEVSPNNVLLQLNCLSHENRDVFSSVCLQHNQTGGRYSININICVE